MKHSKQLNNNKKIILHRKKQQDNKMKHNEQLNNKQKSSCIEKTNKIINQHHETHQTIQTQKT